MSLIINFLRGLFGNNPKGAAKSTTNDYMQRWEEDRRKSIKATEQRLGNWIIALVNQKGSLPFSWESGNDEAFLTFTDFTEAEEDNFMDLEQYIINKLDIPDAGEFEMTGSGTIYITGNSVRVKYSSTIKGVIDYDEETDQEIYSEEEQDSGDELLFSI
ncbi:hypothetical protein [Mucilaginibacter paludis]|uniref:Uncharacterized protein n=1 Tax=Mucilaginibacter paludis DSM 18603 TaxID=714943 RepID=H1YBG8_9SPHI|nr:hypothetical protein [Mucilaginibacter paludis]EHQ25039.1 hypothetical protein Mucpa_0858 [Mucilaginibacter paludis DSM 18603]